MMDMIEKLRRVADKYSWAVMWIRTPSSNKSVLAQRTKEMGTSLLTYGVPSKSSFPESENGLNVPIIYAFAMERHALNVS